MHAHANDLSKLRYMNRSYFRHTRLQQSHARDIFRTFLCFSEYFCLKVVFGRYSHRTRIERILDPMHFDQGTDWFYSFSPENVVLNTALLIPRGNSVHSESLKCIKLLISPIILADDRTETQPALTLSTWNTRVNRRKVRRTEWSNLDVGRSRGVGGDREWGSSHHVLHPPLLGFYF